MDINKIEEIAKRRGFFWRSSELYGGISGLYDYAHLGKLIKRKLENLWRAYFLGLDENFYEIETPYIVHENALKASGHVDSFVDPIAKCKKCGATERADHIIEDQLKESFEGSTAEELTEIIKKHKIRCPKCKGILESVGTLNMMFPIEIGANAETKAYLLPETAQGAYLNFPREFECLRKKMPIGLAIIGRAYRNEISPRNALIRMREFTQAELQIFFDPDKINEHPCFADVEDYKLRIFPVANREKKHIDEITCKELVKRLPKFYVYHMAMIQKFYLDILKIPRDKFRFKELSDEEKAFYNKYHWDIELEIDIGFKEVAGVHYRTDHDLKGHEKVSKQDMSVFVDDKKFVPHVLELSFGIDRNIYALLVLFYEEEKERTVFRFPGSVSPYDAAVFPLISKDELPEKACEIKKMLRSLGFTVFYDESGSIGRRYRRMDEIGVPASITVDHQTLKDSTVTLRDRDSMKQIRVNANELCSALRKFLDGEKLEKLGKSV